jgi:RHS repeat-associated protein
MREPLVATGPVSAHENSDLDAALSVFREIPATLAAPADFDDYAKPLLAFVEAHPNSNWNAALYANLGFGYYHAGYYSRTFAYLEKAWQLGRNATSPQARLMVDRAVGELARMHARVGHDKELNALLADIGDRPIGGPATELIQGAREGQWTFRNNPGEAYLCGPNALRNLLIVTKATPEQIKVAQYARSGPHGFSLEELAGLAGQAKLDSRIIHRNPNDPIPVPSIIHWKVNHFAAIVAKKGELYQIADPTFGSGAGSPLTARAIDAESSGYFLVPASVVASQANVWRNIPEKSPEAKSVYGMGTIYGTLPGANCPCDTQTPTQSGSSNQSSSDGSSGMVRANAHIMTVSLHLVDTPVGYRPQKGPSALTTISYSSRESEQPANFSFSNLGDKWSHSWLAYVEDDPNSPGSGVSRISPGGGAYEYDVVSYYSANMPIYNSTTGAFIPETYDNSQLYRYPANGPVTSYVRRFPNGSREVYGLSNGASTFPRVMFLTELVDPAGNKAVLSYDNTFRLTSVTDAMGRKTVFHYSIPKAPLLITSISDPFGRTSNLAYDAEGRLIAITDSIGITSSFTYGSASDSTFITKLTTPYGTSLFSETPNPNDPQPYFSRSLTLTDPLGHTEFLYLNQDQGTTGTPTAEAAVPTGMTNDNGILQWRNTYYWNRHQSALGVKTDKTGTPTSENFADATIYHWLHFCCSLVYESNQLGSVKRPLEKFRQWINYPNPSEPQSGYWYWSGSLIKPSAVGRVLDDGSTQVSTATYNSLGLPLMVTDPVGRVTKFTYASNNIDLFTVQQLTASPATFETIATLSDYNSAHEPQSYTGPDGRTWRFTYNAAGQLLTITDPKNEVTTYHYDSIGRLSSVENANQKTALTLTYDSADRVETQTDSEGYKIVYAYDNLDRVTKVAYPDGTTDQYDYNFQSGAEAGTPSLDVRKYADRLKNSTIYEYDADERLTSVTEPVSEGNTRTTSFAYFEDGTLKEIADPKGNVTLWAIDQQSRPISKTYGYGTKEAESEIYDYEMTNSRLHSVKDAMNQVKTFGYAHDDRITNVDYTHSVNSTPNVALAYDPYFPRVASMKDGTGTTGYEYFPVGALGALQLSQEHSSYLNETIGYGYDSLGRLTKRAIDSSAETWAYDSIGRLITHVGDLGTFDLTYLGQTAQPTGRRLRGTSSVGTDIAYEANVDDRRMKSISNIAGVKDFAFDTTPENLFSSITETKSGTSAPIQTWDYTYDKAYRLTTANSTAGPRYSYDLDLDDNITGESGPGYQGTGEYDGLNELTYAAPLTFTYDKNGNMLSDGFRTFKWDAENRLIGVSFDSDTARASQFRYDGFGRRVSIASASSRSLYVWCGNTLCAARDAAGDTTRRYYPEGESSIPNSELLYYSLDQLGSVRGAVGAQGKSKVAATYDYDPYGFFEGFYDAPASLTDFRYAGMFYDKQDGLYLSTYRAYEPRKARWLSRDPLREAGGVDLYSYVGAQPVSTADVLGLDHTITFGGAPYGGRALTIEPAGPIEDTPQGFQWPVWWHLSSSSASPGVIVQEVQLTTTNAKCVTNTVHYWEYWLVLPWTTRPASSYFGVGYNDVFFAGNGAISATFVATARYYTGYWKLPGFTVDPSSPARWLPISYTPPLLPAVGAPTLSRTVQWHQ